MKNKISAIIVAFFIIHFLIFILMSEIPGSGFNIDGLTKEQINQIGSENGFNKPIILQYLEYWSRIIQLDFGKDINTSIDLQQKTLSSLTLSLSYNVIAVFAALYFLNKAHQNEFRKNEKLRKNKFELFLLVIPYSIVVPLSVMLLAVQLKILPAIYSPNNLISLLLPVIIASIYIYAQINFAVKSQLEYYKATEWIENKKRYNIPIQQIYIKELKPIINFEIVQNLSRLFIGLVFGSIIIELAFEIPGIGRMLVESINSKNIRSAMNIVTLMLIINLIIQIYSHIFVMRRQKQ
jgi:ABC-type dipeptide/oligopeptide/nickel transport system permease component